MRKIFAIVAIITTMSFTAGARGLTLGASADGDAVPHIYGYCVDADPDNWDFMPGIYNIIPDFGEVQEDPVFWMHGLQAYDGWYHDGKVSGIVTVLHTGLVAFYFQYVYDLESGEELFYKEYYDEVDGYYIPRSDSGLYLFQSRLNTKDGMVYGYAYNLKDQGNIYWAKADFDDLMHAEPIKKADDEVCYSLCYNEADGYFYGVNAMQQFVRMGVDGNQKVISQMPNADYLTTNMAGLTWSPVDDCFYWTCLDAGGDSRLLTISRTGDVSFVKVFEGMEYFTFLFSTDEVIPDTEPPYDPDDTGVDDIVSEADYTGHYAVYTLEGRLVKAGNAADGNITATLPQGIYVVRAGNKVSKIIIN